MLNDTCFLTCVIISRDVGGVSLEILNSTMLTLSEAAYDSKILGDVVSSKTKKSNLKEIWKNLVCMSMMKYPKIFCGLLSCAIPVCVVGCNAFLLRLPNFVKCVGNSFLYLLSGMVLTSVPGSILTGSNLLPCFVIICGIV